MSPQKTTKTKTKTKTKTRNPAASAPRPLPANAGTKIKTGPATNHNETSAPPNLPVSPRATRSWDLPEPWMTLWVDTAIITSCLTSACEAALVSLGDVFEARRAEPAFHEAFRTVDEIIDLAISGSVRAKAAVGDIRSQVLYFNKVRDLTFNGEHDTDIIISPADAEAMIRSALGDQCNPFDAAFAAPVSPAPAPSPSKATSSPSRKSAGER